MNNDTPLPAGLYRESYLEEPLLYNEMLIIVISSSTTDVTNYEKDLGLQKALTIIDGKIRYILVKRKWLVRLDVD